jgi:uncharacterized protein (DUF433 family)
MTTTLSGHIEVDDNHVARVSGTRIKVIHLVMEKMANGWGPEEIQRNFPHLSLAAVYAAFSYYHDHKGECDKQIEASVKFAEEMRAQSRPPPVAERLRAEGKLS